MSFEAVCREMPRSSPEILADTFHPNRLAWLLLSQHANSEDEMNFR